MNRHQRTLLFDVSTEYLRASESYERHASRGDVERADEALSRMQELERCVSVTEHNTSWRRRTGAGA